MEQTLDIKALWRMLTKHLRFIGIITVSVTIIAFLISFLVIPPKYTSEAMLYVENKQSSSENMNINDLTVAQELVNTCSILFTSDSVLEKVKTDLELNYDLEKLEKMITVESVNNSEILKITVESKSAVQSYNIATKLVELSHDEFLRVIKSGSIEVVSEPKVENKPTSPNIPLITAAGFVLGAVCAVISMLLIEILNTTVTEEDDLTKIYNIPVFAEVMDFEVRVKGDYKYE